MNGHYFHSLVGTGAPAAAVLISFSEAEAWLRIASLLLGICIGAVSLYKMLKAKKP
jgi:ABC-type nickel/cobalt efflux system permease component RcnA